MFVFFNIYPLWDAADDNDQQSVQANNYENVQADDDINVHVNNDENLHANNYEHVCFVLLQICAFFATISWPPNITLDYIEHPSKFLIWSFLNPLLNVYTNNDCNTFHIYICAFC